VIDLDDIGMKSHIRNEITRFNRFQKGILGIKGEVDVKEVDIRNYAKYILRDGRDYEKRELLQNFKSKILFGNKIITLTN
jgi:hypothetical protein